MSLTQYDALELSGLLARREIGIEELMRATLDRIGALNGAVNAIVSLRPEDALLAEARAADRSVCKGWMHGLPLAVKDLVNAATLPTTMGSPAMAGQIAGRALRPV